MSGFRALLWRLTLALAAACAAPAAAQMKCGAAHRFTLDFDAYAAQPLSEFATYAVPVTNAQGDTVTMTLSFGGDVFDFANGTPELSNQNSGAISPTPRTLYLYADFDNYTEDIGGNTDVITVNVGFSERVRDVRFSIFDVDYFGNQFRDWIRVTGSGAAASVASLSTPYNPVGAPDQTNPPSTVVLGPTSVPVGGGTIVSPQAGDAIGTDGNSTATQDYGNLDVVLAEDIDTLQVRYGNAGRDNRSAGVQAISIHDISFCTMPDLVVAKYAEPIGSGNAAYSAPGNDHYYVFNVTNSGGSEADAGSLQLTDFLPADVTFYNGDIAGAGSGPFQLVDSGSGISCCASGAEYATGSPAAFGYTPASGYDANVNGVRLTPGGAMREGSSFLIRFRVRIK